MNLQRTSIFGSDNIGIYVFTNNKYSLVPRGVDKKLIESIEENLGTQVIEAQISGTFLLGILLAEMTM